MKSEFSVHRADRGTQLSHRSLSAKINSSSPVTKLSIHMTGECIVSKVNGRLKPSHLRYQPTRIARPFQIWRVDGVKIRTTKLNGDLPK